RPSPRHRFTPRHLRYNQGAMDVQQMVIYGVSFDVVGKQPIVLLKTMEGNRFLPIWIGHPEAAAILIKLQGTTLPRPMTHDLLTNVLGTFEAQIERITVTELRDSTFYATLTLMKDGAVIEVDSRPSDALALAVRTDAPIFASNELVEENAIEFEREVDETDEIVEGFRDFLEKVSPDDFRVAQEILEGEDDELDDDELDDEGDEDEDDLDEDLGDEGLPSN
ncbi:MAG: bifunctional nuclease family protein, partial [Thermoleophilia bacterium]|nr:bifunctional nuclease family protein [Thermoleophilia bacterium]